MTRLLRNTVTLRHSYLFAMLMRNLHSTIRDEMSQASQLTLKYNQPFTKRTVCTLHSIKAHLVALFVVAIAVTLLSVAGGTLFLHKILKTFHFVTIKRISGMRCQI